MNRIGESGDVTRLQLPNGLKRDLRGPQSRAILAPLMQMTLEAKIAPPNSLLFVMDKDSSEIPDSMDGLVAATPSCIAVGTLSAVDGKTSVTLSDDRLVAPGTEELKKVFSGVLATPRHVVEVYTVLREPILTLPVHGDRSGVEIWANSETEPDRLYVLIL